MTGFVEQQAHRQRMGRQGYATIEIGHTTTTKGLTLQVPCTDQRLLAHVMDEAFDEASQLRADPTDPGSWAVLIGHAALRRCGNASVQRVQVPGERHVVVLVEPGRMLESHPLWPLVRYGPTGRWHDHRSQALMLGPADAELTAYAEAYGIDLPVAELRSMFDQGVIEWVSSWDGDGRRLLVPASVPR